jgi:diguanylate cyclase (GGDEF)-like protein/PAS domain S-box-containing protein
MGAYLPAWLGLIISISLLILLVIGYFQFHRLLRKQRQSEERLQGMFDSTDGILWEADANTFEFTYISPSAKRLLGFSTDEWLQPGFWLDHIHPDNRDWAVEYCQEQTQCGLAHDFEYKFICKDGRTIWMRDIVSVIKEEGQPRWLRGLMIDISAQKQLEQQLIKQREAILDIIALSPVPCAFNDIDRAFTYVNQAFTQTLGYTVEDISSLNKWYETAYPDPVYRALVKKNRQKNHVTNKQGEAILEPFESTVRCKNGDDIHLVINAQPFVESGNKERLVIFHDVTRRKKAEEELIFKNMLLAAQLEASPDALQLVDEQRRVISVNKRYQDLWGLSKSDIQPGADARLQRKAKEKLVKIDSYVEGLEHLFEDTEKTSIEEIEFKDGRFFERYSAPLLGAEGHYYGRLSGLRETTNSKQAESMIWTQANFDQLTNLPNRRMLYNQLESETKKAARNKLSISILCLDLDHFKEVNDTLGHSVGDTLLKAAAQRLLKCVRETDIVGRLGGDEFIVALCDQTSSNNVEKVATKILRAFEDPFVLGQEIAHVSTSIGITSFPQDGTNFDVLLKNADQAMYAAKSAGRSNFHFFTEAMQTNAIERMRMLGDLRSALTNKELYLLYQPIVHLASGNVCKAEALLRWQHPDRGIVNPSEFIPLAEESGLIIQIGNWVFQEAAKQTKQWHDNGHIDFQVSINTSPVQFRDSKIDFSEWFEYLEKLNLPGNSLNVEITEGLLMETRGEVMDKLLAFRDAGILVSLDDFGTGYSSLAYLKKFDIDYLKIDQSFVANLAPGSDDFALCEAIIVMAHKLNIEVIAEGIETREQRDLLTAAGCDFGQGYLYSKPVPTEDFESLLGNLVDNFHPKN